MFVFFFFFFIKTGNRQADVFSCLYSENSMACGTLGGVLVGRKVAITALFTLITSGLVLKRLGIFIFESVSLSAILKVF